MIRAALRSLLARRVRLLLSTFAIVLGVAFVSGTLVFTDTLQRSFTALFASAVGDVVVQPRVGTGPDGAPAGGTVPASYVDRLATLPGAARADGQVSTFGVYVVDRDGKLVGGFGAPGLGGNWSDAPAGHGLEGLAVVEGEKPQGRDEVVLDAETADRGGYDVGDRVPLVTVGAQARLEPELVGIADFPEGGSLNGASFAMFDTATAQDLFLQGRNVFTSVWVTAADGVTQEELRDQVARELPDGLEALTGDVAAEETASGLLDAIGFISTFLLIFAGISLVVGAFLIVNTFSILVAQRSRELALLRALGASRRQVTGSVLLEAVVVGLVGSTVGLALGVVLALVIRAAFARLGLDLTGQPLVFGARTFVVAYVVGVLVTTVSAGLPARRTGRIAPVQALRDEVALPEASLRRRLLVGAGLVAVGAAGVALGLFADLPQPVWSVGLGVLAILLGVAAASPLLSRPLLTPVARGYARAFGAVGRLAGQNALRQPRRTAATASALMIGLTLACTMAMIGASAGATIDRKVEESFVGDYIVSNVLGGAFSPEVAEQMATVDGVGSVVPLRYQYAAEVDGEREGVGGSDPDAAAALELAVVEGTAALDDGEALVQREWADDHGTAVGDTLAVAAPAGERELRVVGVVDDNPVVLTPVLTTLDELTAAGFPPQDNMLVIDADGSPEVERALEDVVADLPIVTVKDEAAFAQEQREPVDRLVMVVNALLGLALVIAVLGIVNTLALSIIERTREIGLLRAIGLGRGQLRWMVTLESVVIALLGTVLGVVLGLVFGTVLLRALRDEGVEVIRVPVAQIGVFLVLAVVVGVLAAVVPARRAARLDVLRAIAAE